MTCKVTCMATCRRLLCRSLFFRFTNFELGDLVHSLQRNATELNLRWGACTIAFVSKGQQVIILPWIRGRHRYLLQGVLMTLGVRGRPGVHAGQRSRLLVSVRDVIV